jgi:hypothetical protein
MDIRRAYIRRSVKQARLQKRLAVAVMLTVSCCAAFLLRQEPQQKVGNSFTAAVPDPAIRTSPEIKRVAEASTPAAPRRVYPFSIVPGGVTSRADIAHAILADKTVAAHYAGFAVDRASLQTVPKARAVYVSYRKGDQVYWTSRPVTLAEGESILSDGQNDIRARCGNRISDTPQLPVEAKGPGEQELDTPVVQAQDGGEGALLLTAAALEEEAGAGRQFIAQTYPNGAGLLPAPQGAASLAQTGFNNGSMGLGLPAFPVIGSRQTLLADVSSPASGTTEGSAASSDPTATAGGLLSYGSDSGGSGKGGDPALSGALAATDGGTSSGGTSTGSTGGTTGTTGGTTGTTGGTATKPAGTDPLKPPAPTLQTDPATDGKTPTKPHELPEPGSLWLTGVAAIALLLHRRLRPRKPR